MISVTGIQGDFLVDKNVYSFYPRSSKKPCLIFDANKIPINDKTPASVAPAVAYERIRILESQNLKALVTLK